MNVVLIQPQVGYAIIEGVSAKRHGVRPMGGPAARQTPVPWSRERSGRHVPAFGDAEPAAGFTRAH